MSENELGLTMDDQASPDLNESSEQEAVEFDDTPAAEQPAADAETDKRQRTKQVSDRINQIRAEAQQEADSLREQLEQANSKLYEYQANEEGISLDEFMARKQSEEDRIREAIDNDPEVRRLRQSEFERIKADTLAQIQDAYPNEGIEDIDHFPSDFYAMLRVGVDPVIAYRAAVADEKKSTPPSTGSVKSKGEAVKGNLSEEQALSMDTSDWISWLDENET